MAETKGMIIELGVDVTKFNEAISKTQSSLKRTESELKLVERSLKFNPNNVTLLQQKFDLLTKSVEQNTDKLNQLNEKQNEFDANNVDKNTEEYRQLEREIIKTQNQIDRANSKLREMGNIKLKVVADGFKNVGSKLTKAGEAMRGFSVAATAAAAAVGALAVKSAAWADDVNTMSKVYHIGTQDLQKYSIAANLVDVDLETITKSHVKLEKSMSSATKKTSASAKAFKKLGVSVKDSDGNFRDSDEVWQDTIKALGGIENETERDTVAMQLFGKSAAELNPLIEDGGETYKNLSDTLAKYHLDFIDQETLDRANQFNDQIDIIKAIGLVTFQTFGTELASNFAPVLEKVVDLVGRLASWFTSLSPQTQAVIGGIIAASAVLAPLLIALGKLSFAISAIISLAGTLGPILAGAFTIITGPVGIAIAAIAGAIAVGVLLYKNWDKIKKKANEIKSTVINAFNNLKTKVTGTFNAILTTAKTTWGKIRDAIINPIQKARDTVKGIIDKIRNFFPLNVGKIFSGLQLPHFKISGGKAPFGIGGKGTKPSIDVDWYDKAMQTGRILKGATLFGMMGDKLLGGGETGREVVAGAGSLSNMITTAVSRGLDIAAGTLAQAFTTQAALSGGVPAQIVVPVYLFKNGPQMGRFVVDTYDKWKPKMG